MFTVWPDTATLDTTPALPSPWSYSQIKQFFSLASRTAWTESLQTDFVHLHATPPLNQWLGEGCWIWGSSQVQSQHICVSTGTIGQRAEQSIGSQTEEEAASWNLAGECVCVSVCTFVCACMNSPFVKKTDLWILDMYLRININVLGLAPCITIHPHRVWLHRFGSPENPAYVSECRNAFVKIKPHTVSLKLNTLQLHTKVYLMYHRKHLLCLWFF